MGFPARRRDRPAEIAQSPRAEWYDRNPSPIGRIFTGWAVAPHGYTVRASYTVPTNKKAWVSTFYAQIVRQTAATTAGILLGQIASPTSPLYPLIRLLMTTNGVGDTQHETGSGVSMIAGDALEIGTYDGSTGGTVAYEMGVAITQFDA